jgi:hypothetical protein
MSAMYLVESSLHHFCFSDFNISVLLLVCMCLLGQQGQQGSKISTSSKEQESSINYEPRQVLYRCYRGST